MQKAGPANSLRDTKLPHVDGTLGSPFLLVQAGLVTVAELLSLTKLIVKAMAVYAEEVHKIECLDVKTPRWGIWRDDNTKEIS